MSLLSPQPSFDCLTNNDEAPISKEVVDDLKKLINFKSPGVDASPTGNLSTEDED